MKVKIDKDLCIGCGNCESICPEVFKIKDDNKSYVIGKCEGNEDCCREAAENCPVEAIIIME